MTIAAHNKHTMTNGAVSTGFNTNERSSNGDVVKYKTENNVLSFNSP